MGLLLMTSMDLVERARRIHDHASSLGFDWRHVSGVFDKVREETEEIAESLRNDDAEAARREFGDLFFTLVNLSRFLDADPGTELSQACDRFESRFRDLQSEVKRRGKRISDCSLDDLNEIWESIKQRQAECIQDA